MQQPGSGLDWSIAEEVARQAAKSRRIDIEGARITLPHYARGRTTWLSVLHESEHPKLKFDKLLGSKIVHLDNDTTSVYGTDDIAGTATASYYTMESGIHFAKFAICGHPRIGISRPMPNLDPDRFANQCFSFFSGALYDDFLATRSDEWGSGNVHACEYGCRDGRMISTDWGGGEEHREEWEGMGYCKTGDTIGMLLNLDVGTLTVYKNDRRLGVMKDGLSGSYCWYVTEVLQF